MLSQSEDKKQYIGHILKNLPRKPGVYRMKSADGTVIYVGKAVNLKSRVSSYFNDDPRKAAKTASMVKHIADIDCTVVNSDLEALMLETNLIKELRPKYNVLMKDDKNYVYLKITVAEPYPRIYLVRKVAKDGAKYFGPKTAAYKVISTLKLLKSIFPYKNCELALDYGVHAETRYKHMTTAGLEYHRAHCLGPCISSVSSEQYRETVDKVIGFFEGKQEEIINQVKASMRKAAEEKKFELAASLRDKLKNLEDISKTQIVTDPGLSDIDIINYTEQDGRAFFVLFQVRSGKLIGQENFIFKTGENDAKEIFDPDVLSAFMEQYYEKATDIPREILLPHETSENALISDWLSGMAARKVAIKVPERGKKNSLLDLAAQNARNFARLSIVKWQGAIKSDRIEALISLQEILKLETDPKRIECYDISHFQGSETVGSMVVFENGFPKKEDYRHFRVRTATPGSPDDFASLAEILERRLKYLKPSIAAATFKIKKATKKELKSILKKGRLKGCQKEKDPGPVYYTVEDDGKACGNIAVRVFSGKKALIEKMDFALIPDIATLMKKTAEKIKVPRLHIACPVINMMRFEEAGCQIVQKVPDWISIPKKTKILVYDKIRQGEDKSFSKIPDLIVIDGGKGQLSSALKVLEKFELQLPLISIAKKNEEIFTPANPAPLEIAKESHVSHLIQHIRDESHRFAITYHKKLQLSASTSSVLDGIFGLGEETKMKLLRRFGSVDAIRSAGTADIAEITGKDLAAKLKLHLQAGG